MDVHAAPDGPTGTKRKKKRLGSGTSGRILNTRKEQEMNEVEFYLEDLKSKFSKINLSEMFLENGDVVNTGKCNGAG